MTIPYFWTSSIKRNMNLIQCIRQGIASIKLKKHQAIPLRKCVKRSKLVCSFKEDFIISINNVSKFLLIWSLDGALRNRDQLNKSLVWFFICWTTVTNTEITFLWKNEAKSKGFIRKFHKFTNDQLSLLFRLKGRKLYPACKIYYGKRQCGKNYVEKTIRNTATRLSELRKPPHQSEPAQHIETILDIYLIEPYWTFIWLVYIMQRHIY